MCSFMLLLYVHVGVCCVNTKKDRANNILRSLLSPLKSQSSGLFDRYLPVWLKAQSCVSGVPWQQLRPLYIINSQGFCVASVIIPGKGSVSILCPYLSFPGRAVRHLVWVRVGPRERFVCLRVCACERYSHTCPPAPSASRVPNNDTCSPCQVLLWCGICSLTGGWDVTFSFKASLLLGHSSVYAASLWHPLVS